MRRITVLFLSSVLFTAAALAQPAINPGGVTNIASVAPDGLPNSGIAQGSIFVVNGTGLGDPNPTPMNLFQNTTYPLPTSLNSTSIQFSYNPGQGPQDPVNAIMLYESPTMLAAILPSSAQTGNYTVSVTYDGQSSGQTIPVHVVRSAFGVFTLAQLGGAPGTGTGQGLIQSVSNTAPPVLNGLAASALPGSTVVLYGTGLGAVSGDESQGPAQSGVIGLSLSNFQVFVGNLPVVVTGYYYAGRFVDNGVSYAGVDVVEFQVPVSSLLHGCYVPVTVISNGVTSNTTTMAIDAVNATCSDALYGYSLADLQQISTDQLARIGAVSLSRLNASLTGSDGTTQSVRADGAAGNFANISATQFNTWPGNPSPGGCVVSTFYGSPPPTPLGTPLDAGPVLNLSGPDGAQQLTQSADGTAYGVTFTAPFVDTGTFTLDNGGGGADVGPFQATVNLPGAPLWFNASTITAVAESAPLLIEWNSGGDRSSLISILGRSFDPTSTYGATFQCTASITDGTFSVPNYVLTWLPTNTVANSLLFVTSIGQGRFQAPGLEVGYVTYTVGTGKSVQFVARPNNVKE